MKILAKNLVLVHISIEHSFNDLILHPDLRLLWIKCLSGKQEDSGELTEKEIIRAERNSGVISNRVREIQVCMSFLKMAAVNIKLKLTFYFLN